ncbi:hypothetical protein [Nocardia sp. NPDC047654]|uniref:hypothetical protein n=1 Tax=Nocardia sp. NPDC047654 TaxID=3364314 RepID=UPI00371E5903
MFQASDDIGFQFEPSAQFFVLRHRAIEQFERHQSRQPWVAGQIDGAHTALPEHSLDQVAGERLVLPNIFRPPLDTAHPDRGQHIRFRIGGPAALVPAALRVGRVTEPVTT